MHAGRRIYIVTHPNHEGWLKLGVSFDVERRLKDYNVGCPDKAFRVAYEKPSMLSDVRRVSATLREMNIEQRGEWYKMDLEELIQVIAGLKVLAA